MTTLRAIEVTINGASQRIEVDPRMLLGDALRLYGGSKGTHLGCEHGVCGACTVLVNGVPVRSCLMFAVQIDQCIVETVEGLAQDGDGGLTPLQDALRKHHGLQCGFCTPGILMSLTFLLRSAAHPSEADIRRYLQGHICRCTGYQQIVDAALEVSSWGGDD